MDGITPLTKTTYPVRVRSQLSGKRVESSSTSATIRDELAYHQKQVPSGEF
jgi:hypothetical protein